MSASVSAMNAKMDLQQILRPVEGQLDRVTQRLLACLQHPVARQVVYLITAGGKRLRPALVLLAGRSGPRYRQKQQALVDLAAAVELIHTATLIHDDIIDGSELRRKQPTFHHRFGTERAVLMGDYLYATAFQVLAQLGDSYVTNYMAEICQQMSLGEFLEVESRFNIDAAPEVYLQVVKDKTASLIAASCHLGALLTRAKPSTVARLTQFGWNYGMAFQIMDDCLDLIGQEDVVGKNLRSDLEKGSLSLPVIYLVQRLSKAKRAAWLTPLRRRRAPDRRTLSRIATAARESGAVTQALSTADEFLSDATGAVAQRDGVVLANTYRQLARYAIQRVQ